MASQSLHQAPASAVSNNSRCAAVAGFQPRHGTGTRALKAHLAKSSELVVIGGGFCGLSTALHLAEAGLRPVVLEAREIGFGGPASPRGYVRMNFDRRDPWEAVETKPGQDEKARRENARVG